jgi:hypothetical protein
VTNKYGDTMEHVSTRFRTREVSFGGESRCIVSMMSNGSFKLDAVFTEGTSAVFNTSRMLPRELPSPRFSSFHLRILL